MTVEALMTQPVTLRVRTGETQNAIGEPTATFAESSTTMYLEPLQTSEVLADRNTPITEWVGYGRADIDFTAWDQIVYGDHTFDIAGAPLPKFNPTLGAVSHVEMPLREVL
jgi:hypothetical protein